MTRTMKDSGVEWIGEVPEQWILAKLKYNCSGFQNGSSQTQLNSDISNYPVTRIETISTGKIDFDKVGYVENINNNYLLKKNDFLISNINSIANLGNNAIFDSDRPLYHGMNLLKITPKFVYPKFLYYYFNSGIFRTNMQILCKPAINQASVSASNIKNIKMPLPPLPEQQAIANYLDEKCAQIDNITATINEQIEVLKQYKKSVITEAVTKGLDPNVPMKDSGVEWIGQIPEHWNIEKFKYDFTFSKGLQITKADLTEEGCPVISYGQIHSKINNSVSVNFKLIRFVDDSYQEDKNAITQYGDIIWADTSEDYDGIGNSIFIDSNKNIFAGYHTIITRPLFDKLTKYFAYLFQTDIWRLQLRKQATGIKVFSITQKMLKNSSILIPPLSEQQAIADYLDDKCAQIDAVVADKQAQLETLAAYKKSLIYEYVTGKKSVPGFEEA